MLEKANMQEGKSKFYTWYAKMYVEMLFRLLSLPFIFLILIILAPVEMIIQTLRKFDQQPFRKSLTKNASPASQQDLGTQGSAMPGLWV